MKDGGLGVSRRRRLRILLGALGLLAVAWAIAPALGRLGVVIAGAGDGRQSWMTDDGILGALDGQTVVFNTGRAEAPFELIVMRRRGISALMTGPGGDQALGVEFDLDHEGRRFRVEGRLMWDDYINDGNRMRRFTGFEGVAYPVTSE